MTAWEGLNRRRFPRVNFPCLVIVKHEEGEKDVLLAHTENIGIGGVCVILQKTIKMFAVVELELDLLDGDNHIHCKAKVVWSVRRKNDAEKKPLFYDVGLEFVELNPEDKLRIEKTVNRLAKKGILSA